MPHLYVDPAVGLDDAVGTTDHPMKTITRALEQAQTGTVIHLQPGHYAPESGERFPLVVGSGVRLMGHGDAFGQTVEVMGGGVYQTSFGPLFVTIVLGDGSELRGITLSNPAEKGTGFWFENGQATVRDCTLGPCGREGGLLTGQAIGRITQNRFLGNGSSGLTLLHQSRGEIQGNDFLQGKRLGLAIGGQSAPWVQGNQIRENQTGVMIASEARPVFRGNSLVQNREDGLSIKAQALPDLGSSQDPGGNIFRDNDRYDLWNQGSQTLTCAGNWLNPLKINGPVHLAPQHLPLLTLTPRPKGEKPHTSSATPLVSPLPPRDPIQASPFPDVDKHWAKAFIQALGKQGMVRGFPEGVFKPDHSLTRAEYAALVAQVFPQQPVVKRAAPYQDIAPDFWAATAIYQASAQGFLVGFPDGTFRPQQFVTRLQVLLSLMGGLQLPGGQGDTLQGFEDRSQVPSYGVAAVSGATLRGLVVNYPQVTQLNPLKFATRAETVVMLYQALVVQGRSPVLPCPYLVPGETVVDLVDLQDHWSAPYLRPLLAQGLVRGFPDGTFQPDRSVNRATYAALIAQAFRPAPRYPEPSFRDIEPQFWARGAIVDTIRGGFLAGGQDMTFKPQEPVRRYQVWQSLVRGLALPKVPAHPSPSPLEQFIDLDQIPSQARPSLEAAWQVGLILNYPHPQELRGLDPIRRGELGAIVHQALVYQGRLLPLRDPL